MTHACPALPYVCHVELRSKDGLRAFYDNFVLSGNIIVTSVDNMTASGAYVDGPANRVPTARFETRRYRDSGETCRECSRRIFREE